MKTNKHIWSGYRVNFKSYLIATKSILMIHNETVNVWSHLFGALVFIYLFFYTIVYMPPPSLSDKSIPQLWTQHLDISQIDSQVC